MKHCKATGLNLADKPEFIKSVGDRDTRLIENELRAVGQKKEINILFCIIPDSGPTYATIKQMAEIDHGVLTQCIKGWLTFISCAKSLLNEHHYQLHFF